nr:hemagglutinin repeat-containing protein [Aeromonas bestiarum]
MSVFANTNVAKGKNLGNRGRYIETTITAGDTLTLISGRDTTLLGAQVSGNKGNADIGHNLSLTSPQDNDTRASRAVSRLAAALPLTSSGYVNTSRQNINCGFECVVEQTGVVASKQGLDIRVIAPSWPVVRG